jgi:hypothetical protein
MRLRHDVRSTTWLGRERYLVSRSSTPDTELLSMMSAFDVRPTNESIRKGLKRHSIRGSHNDCQCCKVSKCSVADKARQTIGFTKACPLCVKSGHLLCKNTCRFTDNSGHSVG